MKTVFIDSNFMCHAASGAGLLPIQTDFFDGRCDTFINGYRFVPDGMQWMREDGVIFKGEMVSSVVDYRILQAAQEEFESAQAIIVDLAEYAAGVEYENALNALGMEV